VRIRPTELGSKGMLLVTALELAFLATAYSNLFFLLIAFSCVLGVLGLWWSVRNVAGLELARCEAPIAAAGCPRLVTLALAAPRQTRFDLAFTVEVAGARLPLLHLPVLNGPRTASGSLPALPRGIHANTRVLVRSRFPFGLFEVTRTLPCPVELVTHPAPLDPATTGHGTGERELATALGTNGGHELAGLREFRAGDPTGDIHWKATARRGRPIVKEREPGCSDTVEIVLDRRCSATMLETALSHATAVLLAAVTAGRPVLLRSQGATPTPGGPDRSPNELLRWLARAGLLPADASPPPTSSPRALHLPLGAPWLQLPEHGDG